MNSASSSQTFWAHTHYVEQDTGVLTAFFLHCHTAHCSLLTLWPRELPALSCFRQLAPLPQLLYYV